MGGVELSGLIDKQEVLLPVSDIFDFLKIKNSLSPGMDSITGFFLSTDAPFLIDRAGNRIQFQGKDHPLKKNELIRSETNLYLKSQYFGEIFGLDCKFSFRTLSVNMTTKLELPMMREMRLEQIRKNINRLKGASNVDSIIPRSRPAFQIGMADWSIVSTQEIGSKADTRINLALGAVLLGGEAKVVLNFDTNSPLKESDSTIGDLSITTEISLNKRFWER
jgi:hypothetical protein